MTSRAPRFFVTPPREPIIFQELTMKKPSLTENPALVHGRPAWQLSNGETELSLTVAGGQMAPVRFFADSDSPVEPYYVSPWQDEPNMESDGSVLYPLRGDFFCMPFGGNNKLGGEVHPGHGEVAGSDWTFKGGSAEGEESWIELGIETRKRRGSVTKRIATRRGESALYVSHEIEGFAGPVTLGHHAIMRGDRIHNLSCPSLRTGFTDTESPGLSKSGEYAALQPGVFFKDLSAIPTLWKSPDTADCSVFPAREGFVDIIQLFPEVPADGKPQWFTASVPTEGYLWYSLKDPEVLPSTVLWMENLGRHGAPWNGRNVCLGIEEVLSYLASGLTRSAAENELTQKGFKTSRVLDGKKSYSVKNIQGVCRIPKGFDRVSTVDFKPGKVIFHSKSGGKAEALVDWNFVL